MKKNNRVTKMFHFIKFNWFIINEICCFWTGNAAYSGRSASFNLLYLEKYHPNTLIL